MTIEFWDKATMYVGKHISVVEQGYTNNGRAGKYEIVVRNHVSSIVSVLPVTADNEIVLIRQFRIPLAREVIEQPAGLNDRPGESDIDAVKRELLEETGYVSEFIDFALTVPTSSGLTNELISCHVARNCERVSEVLELDTSESIRVFTLPVERALMYLSAEARKGNLVDSKVFMMVQWYLTFVK